MGNSKPPANRLIGRSHRLLSSTLFSKPFNSIWWYSFASRCSLPRIPPLAFGGYTQLPGKCPCKAKCGAFISHIQSHFLHYKTKKFCALFNVLTLMNKKVDQTFINPLSSYEFLNFFLKSWTVIIYFLREIELHLNKRSEYKLEFVIVFHNHSRFSDVYFQSLTDSISKLNL